MPKKNAAPKKIESIRHKDKRKNIPTEELRDFVADEELAPKTMLYPRDPSLDPQLVWKGKDEQDREDLAVPVVPIYIQEKIHPQAIIDALPRIEQADDNQPNLFADFNGGPADFAQKIDFYHHEQNWANRMVLGDSLLVMTSLAEKEGLKGKVQSIYLDPPYGIKFGSNWQVSTRKRDVKDGKAEDATRQPEQVRAFRDTWKLGIHSYLAYLRDRLVVARDLLTETGSALVQIGDDNVHLVRTLMDEVFGSENFCSLINFRTTSSLGGELLGKSCDYIIWYAKQRDQVKFRQLYKPSSYEDDIGGRYSRVELPDGTRRVMTSQEKEDITRLPDGARIYRHDNLTSQSGTEKSAYRVTFQGNTFTPGNGFWKTNEAGMEVLKRAERLAAPTSNSLAYVRFIDDFPVRTFSNVWTDTQTGAFTEDKVYVVQTNTKVVERCMLMTTDPGDLVLDPTCGSGTTAYVAEQWGRRWITCDTSRVALALARTRMMAAKYPYYLLADSPEGIRKEAELTGKMPPEYKTEDDIRKGFVYKPVPHVTLKSIVNNPDIKEGMTREQTKTAIARNAETETLHDQPYEDNKRVRVCGPFSVESLSPHRVLSTADENQAGTVSEQEARNQQDFATMILDNLKKAGVQNTRKNERLTFDRLDPYPGTWLQAAGEYTDAGGKTRRVAVSIGPEHGTVGPDQVKEAAKEAVQGVGFDMLIVCGFAFDPHVAEEAKRYGKLTVLPTKMNPDLAMGDELLKKTGAGNLFMVFGEPDVKITKQKNGQIVAEIKGVDVYDPTTGQIRSASTDDIACWFIDTNYNGESFFVRHAYFTGAEEPYDKLKRALRAEIDESAWSSLYSTVSRPFAKPESGKIAIKVINHYGDEVLKVFQI
ncbi:MAG: site-specific DNA-methyltransferase [Candidatus Binatus sp.]|uniref:site-specific DNA-methyltransferase n=1 Tax=Candidatus Binatus sp. TaxID=2811406 RepID=UPI003C70C578